MHNDHNGFATASQTLIKSLSIVTAGRGYNAAKSVYLAVDTQEYMGQFCFTYGEEAMCHFWPRYAATRLLTT